MKPSDEQLTELQQEMRRQRDGRCVQVDADGCRCLVRSDKHKGPCDFPWTTWEDAKMAKGRAERLALLREKGLEVRG